VETVHLIVSCTDRKRAAVSADLQLRDVADGAPTDRVSSWWERVRHTDVPKVAAHDLYGGEHWVWSLKAQQALTGSSRCVRLWVASAGYGLVPSDAPLKPYSATFTSSVPDAVARALPSGWSKWDFLATWWSGLGACKGPAPGEPRRVTDLARADPRAAVVVVGSPDYIRALEPDLGAAAKVLTRPTRLVVFSNHRLTGGSLAQSLVPIDERARARVGGTMQGLNARVAAELLDGLDGHAVDAELLRARFEQMVEHTSKPVKPQRPQIDDEDVITFIRAELAKNPNARQTALLAELRRSGRACEQGRFRRLFQQHGAK